ncbi:hypothetical protein [Aggregatibacter segnis]|uniref:hypothetical protein n=1 Tax=Aggregatibacter segnis TaxID=739 RepID=UPI0028E24241|nr:hypothetical protein [Aggregatibacter segnis]
MKNLTVEDLKVGHVYSAKRQTTTGFFRYINDRQILFIGYELIDGGYVQYDSPSVKNGSHYPKVSIEKFLKWAKEDVTDLMPKDDWRVDR